MTDYEAKLAQFAAMTKWLTERDPTPAQLAQYDALRDELEALERPSPREAALEYVSWGWPVFPLRPGTKVPATPHGFKDATLDPARVGAYWAANPEANIGLPTGGYFDVIDADLPDGPASLAQAKLPPVHARVSTASGGLHLYVAATGRGNAARFWPGVDYRGRGGYVVAPPSRDARGSWAWTERPGASIRP